MRRMRPDDRRMPWVPLGDRPRFTVRARVMTLEAGLGMLVTVRRSECGRLLMVAA